MSLSPRGLVKKAKLDGPNAVSLARRMDTGALRKGVRGGQGSCGRKLLAGGVGIGYNGASFVVVYIAETEAVDFD